MARLTLPVGVSDTIIDSYNNNETLVTLHIDVN